MKHQVILVLLCAGLLSCLKPVMIAVPAELKIARQLPVMGGDITWTLDFGPFHAYNIQDTPGRILYTDFKTSDWNILGFEFFLSDEDQEEWECYCEFPGDKGEWNSYLRCVFQDKTPPSGKWLLKDSLVVTKGDTMMVREYYEIENGRTRTSLLMGYTFHKNNELRGLVDVSIPSRESVWIYPYMDQHQQRIIAAVSIALILKFRKLHLDVSFEHLQMKPRASDN